MDGNEYNNIFCNKKSKSFNWCLKKEKIYKRRRENFIMLCDNCHIIYDNIGFKKGHKYYGRHKNN